MVAGTQTLRLASGGEVAGKRGDLECVLRRGMGNGIQKLQKKEVVITMEDDTERKDILHSNNSSILPEKPILLSNLLNRLIFRVSFCAKIHVRNVLCFCETGVDHCRRFSHED